MRACILCIFCFVSIGISKGQSKDILYKLISLEKLNPLYLDSNSTIKGNTKIKGNINNNTKPSKTNTYVVVYDFKKGTYERNNIRPFVNQPIIYKIKNINSLAYNISIKVRDSILAYTFNDNINSLLIQSSSIENSLWSKNQAILSMSNLHNMGSIKPDDYKENSKKQAQNETKIIKKQQELNMDLLRATISFNNKTQHSTDSDSVKNQQERETLKKEIADINTQLERIKTIKTKALKKFANDSYKYIRAFGEFKFQYGEINRQLSDFQNALTVILNPRLTLSEFKDQYNTTLTKIAKSADTTYLSLIHFTEKFITMENLYTESKNNPDLDSIFNDGGKLKLFKEIEDLRLTSHRMSHNFDSIRFDILIPYIQVSIPALNNIGTYSFTSAPIHPKRDIVIFDVNIKNRSNSHREAAIERSFRHEEYTRRGTRIDLGIGLAGAIFWNVKQYELNHYNDSTLISSNSKHSYSPTLIGLATLGFRSANNYMLGLSAGMGLNVSKDGIIQLSNFYVGPSLTIGRYDRITLAGGIAIKKLDVLRSGFEEGKKYQPNLDDSDVFSQKYNFGGFLSITYNLTNGMKDVIKSQKLTLY